MILKYTPPTTFGVWTTAMDAQHPLTLSRFWKRRISMLQSAESPPSSLRSWSTGLFSLLLAATIVTLPFVQLTRDSVQAEDKPTEKQNAAKKPAAETKPAAEKLVATEQETGVAEVKKETAPIAVMREGTFLQEVQVKGQSTTVPVRELQAVPANADEVTRTVVPRETRDEKGNKRIVLEEVFTHNPKAKAAYSQLTITGTPAPSNETQSPPVATDDAEFIERRQVVPREIVDEKGNKRIVVEERIVKQPKTSATYVFKKQPESFPVPTPIDQKIIDALEKPTDFPLAAQEKTLQDALNTLCEHVKLKWNSDKKGLDGESISLETLTVTADYTSGVPLRQVLESILEPHGLTYQIRAGSLEITTRSGAARRIYLYPVSDLAKTDEQLRNLVRTLYMTPVLREQEQTQDGDTSVNVQTGTILIRQSFQSHLEVLDLIRTLRSAAALNQASLPLSMGITGTITGLQNPKKKLSATPPNSLEFAVDFPRDAEPTPPQTGTAHDANPWKSVNVPGAKPKAKQKLMYLDVVSDDEELYKLVKAYVRNEGHYPKDLKEFENDVLEKAGYQLIEPGAGLHYEIHPTTHLPCLVPNPKASPPAAPVASPKKVDFMYLDLSLLDDRQTLGVLIRQFAKQHGRYPHDLQECEKDVLEKAGYKLMQLDPNSTYEYRKADHEIKIASVKPKAPAIDPIAEAQKNQKKTIYLDLSLPEDGHVFEKLMRDFAKQNGRYPNDLKELEQEVLEKTGHKLMKLPEGNSYEYSKETHQIGTKGVKPKTPPANPEAKATPGSGP
ncbi:MAG: hypothetical protein U0903_12590 [Planctomycetales bacterium]